MDSDATGGLYTPTWRVLVNITYPLAERQTRTILN